LTNSQPKKMRAPRWGEGDGTYIPVAAAALLFGVFREGVNPAARGTGVSNCQ